MGIYVQFWHCHPGGLADEFLAGPLAEFDAWCVETMAEFPDDIAPSVPPLLRAVRAEGRAALHATSVAEATAVDRLMDTYFGMFCDSRRPDLMRPADMAMLREVRYRNLFDFARESAPHAIAFELWNRVFTGHPVARDPAALPYRSDDGVFRLSFWSLEETAILGDALELVPPSQQADPDALASTRRALMCARERGGGLVVTVA